jgi:hypothetical protein
MPSRVMSPPLPLPTGVPGLDEVLGGSVPEGSCTAMVGEIRTATPVLRVRSREVARLALRAPRRFRVPALVHFESIAAASAGLGALLRGGPNLRPGAGWTRNHRRRRPGCGHRGVCSQSTGPFAAICAATLSPREVFSGSTVPDRSAPASSNAPRRAQPSTPSANLAYVPPGTSQRVRRGLDRVAPYAGRRWVLAADSGIGSVRRRAREARQHRGCCSPPRRWWTGARAGGRVER